MVPPSPSRLPKFGETIAAIATPEGVSAIGIVRLSGELALPILERVTGVSKWIPNRLIHCRFKDEKGGGIDDGMAVYFAPRRSYTGEGMAELQGHGNPALLKRILGVVLRHGARLAAPGEFTLRAFLGGKLNLVQAEAVATLIHAEGRHYQELALTNLSREGLGGEISGIRRELMELLTQVEATIDFPEEDIPPVNPQKALELIGGILGRIEGLLRNAPHSRLVRDGVKVILAGPVNVGKSSLLNRLLGSERSIVTDIPGTTRDFIEDRLEFNGLIFRLFDTAGLRASDHPVEILGIERSHQLSREADILVHLFDVTTPEIPTEYPPPGPNSGPPLRVFNKCDRLDSFPANSEDRIYISARTGQGIPELLRRLDFLARDRAGAFHGDFLLNERQVSCLQRSEVALHSVRETLTRGQAEDLIAGDIMVAMEELGQITGQVTSEEILGAIFSTFCVGK